MYRLTWNTQTEISNPCPQRKTLISFWLLSVSQPFKTAVQPLSSSVSGWIGFWKVKGQPCSARQPRVPQSQSCCLCNRSWPQRMWLSETPSAVRFPHIPRRDESRIWGGSGGEVRVCTEMVRSPTCNVSHHRPVWVPPAWHHLELTRAWSAHTAPSMPCSKDLGQCVCEHVCVCVRAAGSCKPEMLRSAQWTYLCWMFVCRGGGGRRLSCALWYIPQHTWLLPASCQ